MFTAGRSQVLYGPFLRDDIPEQTAGLLHILTHWQRYLCQSEFDILMSVFQRTTRFKKLSWDITFPMMVAGSPPTDKFAGIIPLIMERKTYDKYCKLLRDYGILRKDVNEFAIDYSVTAVDLAKFGTVKARVRFSTKGNKTGPYDDEDITDYIQSVMYVQSHGDFLAKQYPTMREDILPTMESDHIYIIENTGTTRVPAHTRGSQNGYETAVEALAAVKAKSAAHRQKRVSRGTVADRGSLFQEAWHKACKDRDADYIPVKFRPFREVVRVKNDLLAVAPDIDIGKFVSFIVENWTRIHTRKLHWVREYPSSPDVMWVCRMAKYYFEVFSKGLPGDAEVVGQAGVDKKTAELEAKLRAADERALRAEERAKHIAVQAEKQIEEIKRKPRLLRRRRVVDVSKPLLDYDTRVNLKGPKK